MNTHTHTATLLTGHTLLTLPTADAHGKCAATGLDQHVCAGGWWLAVPGAILLKVLFVYVDTFSCVHGNVGVQQGRAEVLLDHGAAMHYGRQVA